MKTAVLCVLLAVGLSAADEGVAQRQGPIRGAPTEGCGTYLADRGRDGDFLNGTTVQYLAWTQGYISAYNIFSNHPQVQPPEYSTIAAYLDKYCRENPLRFVINGVDSLIAELGGYRATYLRK